MIATTYQFITNLSFLLYEYEYASILAFFHLLVIFNQKCATLDRLSKYNNFCLFSTTSSVEFQNEILKICIKKSFSKFLYYF